ncbi:hypothetical protein JXL19_11210, partial [bacterium]|nr:hypothetical protein [bacterium]
SLEKEAGFQENLKIKEKQFNELKVQLQEKEANFSDQHQDVLRLKKAIALMEKDIDDMKKSPVITGYDERPDNPAYINIATQIATIEMEIESLKRNEIALKIKHAEYQKRLELAPQIELEYKMLARDYENAQTRYRETMYKLMEAKAAEALEKKQIAEKFTIIDPGIYPEEPYKPNRPAILVIGFFLALGIGIGFASIKEYTDQSVRSEAVLMRITGKPVLTTVPYIENSADLSMRRIKYAIVTSVILSAVALAALITHFFIIRLDILWIKIIRYATLLWTYLPRKI